MSIRVMSRTWDACPYEGVKLLVILALCDFADDDGYCWPKMKQVATKARCSEGYARKCIRDFEKDGWMTTTEHRGTGHQNEYQIHENQISEPVSKTKSLDTQNQTSDHIPGLYIEPSLLPSVENEKHEHSSTATVEETDAAATARSDSPPASGKRLKTGGENETRHLSNQVIRRKMLKARAREWDVDRVISAENPTRAFYAWEADRTLPDRHTPDKPPKARTPTDLMDALERMKK